VTRIVVTATGRHDRLRHSDHLHQGFFFGAFKAMGFDVVAYGPNAPLRTRQGARVPLPYDQGRPLPDVIREVGADLLFCLTRRGWLFNHHGVPDSVGKIVCYPDFHNDRDVRHYEGAHLLVLRSLTYVERAKTLPGAERLRQVSWLPFSFDAQAAGRHRPLLKRIPKVAFAGSINGPHYVKRRRAANALTSAGLMGLFRKRPRWAPAVYFTKLAQHQFGLTCAGINDVEVAKHVEIPAAGSILLTTDGPGVRQMLPTDSYLVYRDDDVVTVVRDALAAPERMEQMATRCREHVHAHHTNAVRVRELRELVREACGV